MKRIIKPLLFFLLASLVFLAGYNMGEYGSYIEAPTHIDLDNNTVSGLLHRCPPWYVSYVVPETFTRLDTVEGRGAWPFHEIVIVINENDTIGFYKTK